MEQNNEISRRVRLDLNEPAELAIYRAMEALEKMPGSISLTEAGIKLQEAKKLISDFIDSTGYKAENLTGLEMFSKERLRQLGKGYDQSHDEMETAFQLSTAAALYISNAQNKYFKEHSHYDGLGDSTRFQIRQHESRKWASIWPWDDHDGRSKSDIITSLAKAGALIAAEIDRLKNA